MIKSVLKALADAGLGECGLRCVVLDCSCWQERSRRWARMTMSSSQGWLCTLPLTSTWNTPARMCAFSSPAALLTSFASLPLRPRTRSRTSWRCERIVLLWIPGAVEALKKCLMAVLVMNDNDPFVCVWGSFCTVMWWIYLQWHLVKCAEMLLGPRTYMEKEMLLLLFYYSKMVVTISTKNSVLWFCFLKFCFLSQQNEYCVYDWTACSGLWL